MSGLVILFLWSFAAATVLPLSSEVPLVVAIRQSGGWPIPVLIATLGNYLGACTTFYLARAVMVSNARLDDAQEGMSAFVEKRTPAWTNT